MPLLPEEACVFPNDLLAASTQQLEGRLPVVGPPYTSPSREGIGSKGTGPGLHYFLPLCKRQWLSNGRKFCSYVPLFTGYVFLHGDADARRQALETNLVACCLPVPDQEQLQADLHRVYHLMTSGARLTPESDWNRAPGLKLLVVL